MSLVLLATLLLLTAAGSMLFSNLTYALRVIPAPGWRDHGTARPGKVA